MTQCSHVQMWGDTSFGPSESHAAIVERVLLDQPLDKVRLRRHDRKSIHSLGVRAVPRRAPPSESDRPAYCRLLRLFYHTSRCGAREGEGESKSAAYADEFRIIALSRYRGMT